MENNNVDFLNYIIKNAEMGISSTTEIITIVHDPDFKNLLLGQIEEYQDIYNLANELLEEYKEDKKDISNLEKITSYIILKLNLVVDKSTSNIAEIMMKESNMGIIDIEKKLNSYNEISKNVEKLGRKILKIEEKKVKNLKQFLKEQ